MERNSAMHGKFNMNQFRLIVFLLPWIYISVGCSSSRTVFDVPQRITGEIMVIGNEPFTRLAIKPVNGHVYLISCDDKIRRSLLANQGKIAELFYSELQKKKSGDEIKVIKVIFRSR